MRAVTILVGMLVVSCGGLISCWMSYRQKPTLEPGATSALLVLFHSE